MKGKNIIVVALILIGAVFIGYSVYKDKKDQKTGESAAAAPAIVVTDAATGKKLQPSDLQGKVVFVNFWASWCPPCKEEMPSIDTLNKQMAKNKDFVMVTILYKDSVDEGLGYLKSNNYSFPVYIDSDGATAKNFGVTGVPETYIIDKKGTLRGKVIGGADWASTEAVTKLTQLINE